MLTGATLCIWPLCRSASEQSVARERHSIEDTAVMGRLGLGALLGKEVGWIGAVANMAISLVGVRGSDVHCLRGELGYAFCVNSGGECLL